MTIHHARRAAADAAKKNFPDVQFSLTHPRHTSTSNECELHMQTTPIRYCGLKGGILDGDKEKSPCQESR